MNEGRSYPIEIHHPTRLSLTPSSSAIPIPSDGIGSPHSSAPTPPGVITKIDTRVFKSPTSSEKHFGHTSCACCEKPDKDVYSCKECTRNDLSFYSKKENILQLSQRRQALRAKITEKTSDFASLMAEINMRKYAVAMAKNRVSQLEKSISAKKFEHSKMVENYMKANQYCVILKKKLKLHEENFVKRKLKEDEKKAKMEKMKESLFTMRKKIMLVLFQLFPVRKIEVEVEERKPSSNDCWAICDALPEEGTTFQVKNAFISMPSLQKLSRALQRSILDLPTELHSSFTALTYTVHLLNLMSFVFDVQLPHRLSLKYLLVAERRNKCLEELDWPEICACSLVMACHLGISPDKLLFHFPHHNLLEMADFFVTGKKLDDMPSLLSSQQRKEIINACAHQRVERDLSDWDILEDL